MRHGKAAAIRAVVDVARRDAVPAIFTTGFVARFACGAEDLPHHFYMVGSMGMAGPIGAGVALATDRPVLVVDGDGALLMNPAALVTAAQLRVRLVHVVLDDGCYDSTGGQPTGAVPGVLPALAEAAGYLRVRRVKAGASVFAVVDEELAAAAAPRVAGPALVHVPVVPDSPVPPRLTRPLTEITTRFRRAATCETF